MSIYTREYLKRLKKEADMIKYNNKTQEIVEILSKAIIFNATKGLLNVQLKIKIVPRNPNGDYQNCMGMNYGPDTILMYDVDQITVVINKLKEKFIDSDIQYVESKDLRGNVIESAIEVKWD